VRCFGFHKNHLALLGSSRKPEICWFPPRIDWSIVQWTVQAFQHPQSTRLVAKHIYLCLKDLLKGIIQPESVFTTDFGSLKKLFDNWFLWEKILKLVFSISTNAVPGSQSGDVWRCFAKDQFNWWDLAEWLHVYCTIGYTGSKFVHSVIGNNCMLICCWQLGGRTDFSKNLRAELYNDVLSIDTAFRHIQSILVDSTFKVILIGFVISFGSWIFRWAHSSIGTTACLINIINACDALIHTNRNLKKMRELNYLKRA
jgi:hypothetical protein